MKKIVFRRSDGGVSITHLNPNDDEQRIKALHIPSDAVILGEGENIEIPLDRKDRDCWDFENGKVVVSAEKLAQKQAKKAEKSAVLEKLKITEQELKTLLS